MTHITPSGCLGKDKKHINKPSGLFGLMQIADNYTMISV